MIPLLETLDAELGHLRASGLLREDLVGSPGKGARLRVGDDELDTFCLDDYLGFGRDEVVRAAGARALMEHGASAGPRVLDGRGVHAELEASLAELGGTARALAYPSAQTARTGLFSALFDARDSVFCDSACHPDLADGVRLSDARAEAWRHDDLDHLEDLLRRSAGARFRCIVTGSISPITGDVANLGVLLDLADRYEALVVIEDSHGLGVLGGGGRGAVALAGRSERWVAVGSLGVALGASGGFCLGPAAVVDWLRQKDRHLFDATPLGPAACAMAATAIDRLLAEPSRVNVLASRAQRLRDQLRDVGFTVLGAQHPAVQLLIGATPAAQTICDALFEAKTLVAGRCYPAVPEGEAQVRLQVTLLHDDEQLERLVINARNAGRAAGVV
jgi:glycine C-acetyltransferase